MGPTSYSNHSRKRGQSYTLIFGYVQFRPSVTAFRSICQGSAATTANSLVWPHMRNGFAQEQRAEAKSENLLQNYRPHTAASHIFEPEKIVGGIGFKIYWASANLIHKTHIASRDRNVIALCPILSVQNRSEHLKTDRQMHSLLKRLAIWPALS